MTDDFYCDEALSRNTPIDVVIETDSDRGHVHESQGAAVIQPQKCVHRALDAMHPIQRDQLHADDVGEEFDLSLQIAGTESDVVTTVRLLHRTHLSLRLHPSPEIRGGTGLASLLLADLFQDPTMHEVGELSSAEEPRKGLMSRVRAYLSDCLVSVVRRTQLEIPILPGSSSAFL